MDKLLNEFTVHRPIDETWMVLTDVERIAPCMPGAALEEIEGDVFRGVVKVKLGAISTAFKGQANFVERDDTGTPCRPEGRRSRHHRQGQRQRLDHRATRIDRRRYDQVCRRDRPAHHREGCSVRSGHHGRCQQEADEPVRNQPQHDARSAARVCRTARRSRRTAAAAATAAARRASAVADTPARFARSRAPPLPPSSCPTWPVQQSSSACCR